MFIKHLTISSTVAAAAAFSACQSTSLPPTNNQSSHSSHTAIVTNTQSAPMATVQPYPLETCIVSDEDLDSMGGEITKTYNGQVVKFCCKTCVREFEASPQKFLTKLR